MAEKETLPFFFFGCLEVELQVEKFFFWDPLMTGKCVSRNLMYISKYMSEVNERISSEFVGFELIH